MSNASEMRDCFVVVAVVFAGDGPPPENLRSVLTATCLLFSPLVDFSVPLLTTENPPLPRTSEISYSSERDFLVSCPPIEPLSLLSLSLALSKSTAMIGEDVVMIEREV